MRQCQDIAKKGIAMNEGLVAAVATEKRSAMQDEWMNDDSLHKRLRGEDEESYSCLRSCHRPWIAGDAVAIACVAQIGSNAPDMCKNVMKHVC